MSRKMLINASEAEEIRVALVEGSILEEYYVERMSVASCLGNIYKGRVTNVEPSIGAAFVEFGGPRHGFLHVSDIMEGSLPEPEPVRIAPAESAAVPAADEGDAGAAAGRLADAAEAEAEAETEDGDEDGEDGERYSVDADGEAELGDDVGDGSDLDEEESEGDADLDLESAHGDADADDDRADGDLDVDADSDGDADARGRHAMELAAGAGDADGDDGSDEGGALTGVADPAGSRADRPAEDAVVNIDQPVQRSSRRRGRRSSRRGKGEREPAAREPAPPAAAADARGSNDEPGRKKNRSILDYVKKGQEIIVQVTKDGIGTKGPTLTTYLSMPGRYLVLMPGHDRRGVSRKIEDAKERDRLKKVLNQLEVRKGLGFIVRTAGVAQTKRALQKDYGYLTQFWDTIDAEARANKAPHLLYKESDLVTRTIRDVYRPEMGDIIVDEENVARRTREFLATVMPKAAKNVKLYNGERPLFTAYGIEDEIGQLFLHRVDLKSGGSLVIEQTEALVAIDVNSGRFREEEDLEETAYKINVEAADAIARQLRLRDLGGVIVLDFIDMKSEKRRRAVERAFRDALKADRARTKVARMSMFGTIEMTRQRVRPSLRQSIFKRCPACRGAAYVATSETLQLNVIRQLKLMLARKNRGLEVFVNHSNAEYLFNEKRPRIRELEDSASKPITIRIEPELRDDEYRIVQQE